jgi:hypothetical protein
MQINGILLPNNIIPHTITPPKTAPLEYQENPAVSNMAGWNYSTPGSIVNISPEAVAAYRKNVQAQTGLKNVDPTQALEGCQTCKSRKYVDQSSDSSVSFQSPQHISPGQAAAVVMSHEREHISNDRARAIRDDRKVISQTVSLSMSACPECGKMYVSGGTARTVTAKNNNENSPEQNKE